MFKYEDYDSKNTEFYLLINEYLQKYQQSHQEIQTQRPQ